MRDVIFLTTPSLHFRNVQFPRLAVKFYATIVKAIYLIGVALLILYSPEQKLCFKN